MKMTITERLSAIYDRFVNGVSYLQSPLLLAIRMYWGWQFYQTGLGKLQNIPKVVDFFTSLGIPFPTLNA
jgi:putative oxidoreductase